MIFQFVMIIGVWMQSSIFMPMMTSFGVDADDRIGYSSRQTKYISSINVLEAKYVTLAYLLLRIVVLYRRIASPRN